MKYKSFHTKKRMFFLLRKNEESDRFILQKRCGSVTEALLEILSCHGINVEVTDFPGNELVKLLMG